MLDYTSGDLVGFQCIMVSKPCRNFLRGFFCKNALLHTILGDSTDGKPIGRTAM